MQPTIDAIEIRHYRFPLNPPFHASWDPVPRLDHSTTVVRVQVGDYEGVGAGDSMLGFAGHEHLFLGRSPLEIEKHVTVLDNLQFHYGRMWPLEVALWDIIGQINGQPLWRLLGGSSPQVPIYASTGQRMTIEERVEAILSLQSEGFNAVKLRFFAEDPDEDTAIVCAVRQSAGPELTILCDANQAWRMPWDTRAPWDFKEARRVADALAEQNVYWLEEPLARHDFAGLAELRRLAKVRIAGGEGNREFSELRQYLAYRSLDIYQPDVVWSTGILRATQIAREVQSRGAIYSPHTWGDGLVLLANLHVSAAVSQAPFIEYPYDPPFWTPQRRDYILPEPITADGHGNVILSESPGLGVTIDWGALEQWRV
ncbi:MAG: mandelate racemase/muconate lactonizing enzyme family protein [Chloroflexota bacterium]|jgi:D-galactarolactone cycloisomerase